MSPVIMLTPRIAWTSIIKAKAKTTTTKPTSAWITCCLAALTFPGSPLERIHLIPPMSNQIKAIRNAAKIIALMTKLRIAPGSATLTLYGLRLISSAKTLLVAAIVPATDEAAAINFFITTHPLSRF